MPISNPTALGTGASAADSGNCVITTSAAAVAGSCIVVCATNATGTAVATCTDSASNSYTRVIAAPNATGLNTSVFVALNATLGSGGTITLSTASGATTSAVASSFTGVATASAVGQTSTNFGTGTALTGGAMTTVFAEQVIVTAFGGNTVGITPTADGNWPLLGTQAGTGTFPRWTVGAYRKVSSAGTYTPALTTAASGTWAAAAVSLKAPVPADRLNALPGLRLRVEAKDVTGVADGGAVTNAVDTSSFAHTVTQATSGNRPTLVLNQIGGQPAFRFVKASSQYFTTTAPNNLHPYTVFVLAKAPGGIARDTLVGPSADGGMQFRVGDETTGFPQVMKGNIAACGFSQTAHTSAWALYAVQYDGTAGTMKFWVNNTSTGLTGATAQTAVTGLTWRIAALLAGETLNGDIAAVAIFDGMLTSTTGGQVSQAASYFQDTYSITVADYIPGDGISLVGSSNSGAATHTTSATYPVPSGAAIGDIALLHLYLWEAADPVPTWPAGFTEIASAYMVNGNNKNRFAWKRLTAADTGSYVVSWSGNQWVNGHCVMIRGGVATGDPIEAAQSVYAANTTATPSTSVTTTTEPFLAHFVGQGSISTHTPPTGFIELQDLEVSANYRIPGSSGTHTASGATTSVATNQIASLIAVMPAAVVETVIVRPNATTTAGGWTTGSASLHAALSDQSDATIITGTGA